MRTLQITRIKELGQALIASGYVCLDEQARALGLSRSTTWTLLQANHKTSGLSAAVINRMLAQPELPSAVHAKILEYVEEKSAGIYGHSPRQVRRFTERLSLERLNRMRAAMLNRQGLQHVAKVKVAQRNFDSQ